jgi:hypothetical protein
MKKVVLLFILLAVPLVLFFFWVKVSDAWCVEDIYVDEVCGPQKIHLATDIVVVDVEEYNLGFCLSKKQSFSLIKFFKARKKEELIGRCHREGNKKDNPPSIIIIIDKIITGGLELESK